MTDFFDDPAFVRDLFDFVLAMGLEFAQAQVDAGADLIGVGDAAASLVGPQIYEEFVCPYEQKMVDGLHAMGTRVRLHICGNTRRILPGVGTSGLRHDRHRLDGAHGAGAAGNWSGGRAGRQHRPGQDAPQRHARDRLRRRWPSVTAGRPSVYRRRRLRSAPRHARGQPAIAARVRPVASIAWCGILGNREPRFGTSRAHRQGHKQYGFHEAVAHGVVNGAATVTWDAF